MNKGRTPSLGNTNSAKKLFKNSEIIDKYLSEREKNVVSSMRSQYEKKKSLSQTQLDYLKLILDKDSEWYEKRFDAEKKEKFDLLCKIHMNTGYYRNIVIANNRNPEYIPSEKDYNSLVKNDYAVGYLAAWYDEPKYKVGELVQGRAGYRHAYFVKNMRLGMVVATNSSIPTSHGKGSKKYEVLCLNSDRPDVQGQKFECEEKHLKIKR